ncbi:MAG: SDR family NAD(P)-dependent oxidoreductase [Alphaproteobacteria bacterium]|nr:SDR family NAD(P)-dependent oxidoreductase [Alphaproteobacteria bacterium]MDP6517811.1 SDR family NAD(P)-dependent oxidoreductase [Alphaproteobacteria bacterium]
MTNSIAVLGVGPIRGLGAAIAKRFATDGFTVTIGGRDGARLESVAAEISSFGGGPATALAVDVTDPAKVLAFFDQVDETPDVVVYNAGNNQRIPFLDITPEAFEDFWRTCCFGGFLVGQEAARRMLPRGRGTILFTGASASRRGRPDFAHFAAGKAGLRMVAESMARTFGPQGLHVGHVIIDGAIDGDRIHRLVPEVAAAKGADGLLGIDAIAETFWQLHHQHPSAWTMETELRPYKEPF